jgi:hypothetical protein
MRWCFFVFIAKLNAKLLLASLQTLTNFKKSLNPSSNTLQMSLLPHSETPLVAVKLTPEPGFDSENCS